MLELGQMTIKQQIKKWYNEELKGHSIIYKVLYIAVGTFIYGLGIFVLIMIIIGLFGGFSNKSSSPSRGSSGGSGVRCNEYEWDYQGHKTCVDPEPVEPDYDYDYEPDYDYDY